MNCTQQFLRDAIRVIALSLDKIDSYEALLSSSTGITRIIEMLICDMFDYNWEPKPPLDISGEGDNVQWYALQLIKNFRKEIKEKGFITYI